MLVLVAYGSPPSTKIKMRDGKHPCLFSSFNSASPLKSSGHPDHYYSHSPSKKVWRSPNRIPCDDHDCWVFIKVIHQPKQGDWTFCLFAMLTIDAWISTSVSPFTVILQWYLIWLTQFKPLSPLSQALSAYTIIYMFTAKKLARHTSCMFEAEADYISYDHAITTFPAEILINIFEIYSCQSPV